MGGIRSMPATASEYIATFGCGRIGQGLFQEYFKPDSSNNMPDQNESFHDEGVFSAALRYANSSTDETARKRDAAGLKIDLKNEFTAYLQLLHSIVKVTGHNDLFHFYYQNLKNDLLTEHTNSINSEDEEAMEIHIKKIEGLKVSDLEPLAFWGKHCDKYPLLARIASVVLAVSASVATGERTFSALKLTENLKRCRLGRYLLGDLTVNYVRARAKVAEEAREKKKLNETKETLMKWPKIGALNVITIEPSNVFDEDTLVPGEVQYVVVDVDVEIEKNERENIEIVRTTDIIEIAPAAIDTTTSQDDDANKIDDDSDSVDSAITNYDVTVTDEFGKGKRVITRTKRGAEYDQRIRSNANKLKTKLPGRKQKNTIWDGKSSAKKAKS